MPNRMLSTAWLVATLAIGAFAHAAEPELETWRVAESRLYERDKVVSATPSVGMPTFTGRTAMNRVTVELAGERVTGEWEWSRGKARAEDFPVGSEVQATTRRNQLLLKDPITGATVRARIVRRDLPDER